MSAKNNTNNYNELLIFSAALVTVVRYAAAFIASDATEIGPTLSLIITYAMGLSGLGMGILDVIGGAYLFTGWQKKMPKNGDPWSFKFKVLSFFAIGLIVNGILILIPFTMSRVAGVSIHHILGDGVLLFGWSAVVNVAPYLLIGGVAVGNTIVTVATEEKPSGNFPGNFPAPEKPSQESSKVPQWRTFKKNVSDDDLLLITNMTPKTIADKYGMTVKAAKDWPEYARSELVVRGVLQEH